MNSTASISERLNGLRELIANDGFSAIIISTADPHLSEYITNHWKLREWFSGFTGSAGTLVVGKDWAGLWTDSRYYLQAEQQLKGSGITLYKEGTIGTPSITDEVCQRLSSGEKVATDTRQFTTPSFIKFNEAFQKCGIQLFHYAKAGNIWSDRPSLPATPVFVHDIKYSGETAGNKIGKIRNFITQKGADVCLISGLDEIAWVLNLRGSDISYNPVFYAYLVIYANGDTVLYANNKETGRDLTTDAVLATHLNSYDIELRDYNDFEESLKPNLKWCYALDYTNAYIGNLLTNNCVESSTPTMMLKSIKNATQIKGLEQAQLADGVAMVQAFCWLDKQLEGDEKVTELSFANYLDQCRAKQKDYFCLSFNTISGFAHHGAIVHYGVTPETDIPLQKGNFLLVDSGCNYLNGTTDITRTILLGGNATEQQKIDYTLVLKGHIALATTPFPEGTSGAQLDTLARQYLWKAAKDYGHGTGHGIGHFLCVHEGPQRISTRNNNIPLKCGMFISNEPGLYIEGQYGIRLENMVCVKNCCQSPFGKFFELATMSFFPFDLASIDTSMLTKEETDWLNNYHQSTYDKLVGTNLLSKEEQDWLRNKTKPVTTL